MQFIKITVNPAEWLPISNRCKNLSIKNIHVNTPFKAKEKYIINNNRILLCLTGTSRKASCLLHASNSTYRIRCGDNDGIII